MLHEVSWDTASSAMVIPSWLSDAKLLKLLMVEAVPDDMMLVARLQGMLVHCRGMLMDS
jgi:hypothetical protein